MTNLPRVTAKIFASNAAQEDIGQYGSAISGTKVTTGDIAEIQALPAYETGWRGAVVSNRNYPTLQEMNGLQKTFSQQIAYLLQKGIPEYDPNTTYYTSSFCQFNGVLYKSISNDNIGNQPDTSITKWQTLNFGNSNISELPLFSTLIIDHVLTGDEAVGWALQGSLITNIYSSAVAKISELYSGGTETEHRGISCKRSTDGRYIADISQKDAIDLLYAATGVSEFYILDCANEQFYLPKSKWFMQLTDDTGLVNGYNEAGLPNITGNIIIRQGFSDAAPSGAFNNSGSTSGYEGSGLYAPYSKKFDASLSNPIYGNSDTVQPASSNKLLYYKVGNTVSNDSLVDVGNVLSELQLKADADLSNCTKPYVTQTYQNGSSWYRIYSDGFKIQAGVAPIGAASVTFAVAFSNLDTVNIQAQMDLPAGSTATWHAAVRSKSLTGFELYEGQYALNLRAITSPANWIAFGY